MFYDIPHLVSLSLSLSLYLEPALSPRHLKDTSGRQCNMTTRYVREIQSVL